MHDSPRLLASNALRTSITADGRVSCWTAQTHLPLAVEGRISLDRGHDRLDPPSQAPPSQELPR